MVAWLATTPHLKASDGPLAPLTFISPIGDPRLSLSKRVDNSAPAPGTQINYTLSYSNTNPGSQGFNVRLYDFLPAGVQFLGSSPSATPDANGVLLFTAPSVGPGTENHDVTVQVRVLDGYPQLTNHALVVADGVTPTFASLVTNVSQPLGQLLLTKMGDSAALINSPVVYVLRCENTSGTPLFGVSLADVLPPDLTFVGASPPPDVATLPLLRWSLGDLDPGQSRSVVVTTTAPASPAVVTNTALAAARQAPMTTTLYSTQVVTQGAILRVNKTGSASQVGVGDVLVYTLVYSNAGNLPATGIIVTDTLPTGITVVSANPTPSSQTSQQMTWQFGSLAAHTGGTIVVTTTVGGPAGRTLHNVVDITAQPGSFPGHGELDTFVREYNLYLPVVMKQ
jgi:uncharacterized repeat protein (TIGR01451 family)